MSREGQEDIRDREYQAKETPSAKVQGESVSSVFIKQQEANVARAESSRERITEDKNFL